MHFFFCPDLLTVLLFYFILFPDLLRVLLFYFLLFLQAPPVKELRKLVRIQALRCHPIYCQNGTRLNVIPVLASRSQALRYC